MSPELPPTVDEELQPIFVTQGITPSIDLLYRNNYSPLHLPPASAFNVEMKLKKNGYGEHMDRMLQIQILREHLITLCRRSARMFRRISETSPEQELKRVARLFSQQRQEFVEELLQCGFPLDDPGEVTESYRTLRHPKEIPDISTQVKDCAEKEKSLLRVYSDALDVELSENLREMITKQKNQIEEACDYIQSRLHMYQPRESATTSSVRW